jgi:replicative DNA helicase
MSRTTKQVVKRNYELAVARRNDPREVWGIPWGFDGLNKLTGGIQREEMAILMARPKVGKTTILEQITQEVCDWRATPDGQQYMEQYHCPDGVIRIVSLEMTAENLLQRITSKMAKVSMRRIREGTLTDEMFARYDAAARLVARLPIEIEDDTYSIAKTERFLRGEERPDSRPTLWWALDYIQIQQTGLKSSWGTTSDISTVTQALRDIAKNVAPGLVLSQMNREADKREDRRPQVSDLKGSGTLEEAGSVIMGLYRDDVYQKLAPEERDMKQPAELNVLRQRNGPMGTVKMNWHPVKQWFEDISDIADFDDEDDAA